VTQYRASVTSLSCGGDVLVISYVLGTLGTGSRPNLRNQLHTKYRTAVATECPPTDMLHCEWLDLALLRARYTYSSYRVRGKCGDSLRGMD
jgi:hypothetical protein